MCSLSSATPNAVEVLTAVHFSTSCFNTRLCNPHTRYWTIYTSYDPIIFALLRMVLNKAHSYKDYSAKCICQDALEFVVVPQIFLLVFSFYFGDKGLSALLGVSPLDHIVSKAIFALPCGEGAKPASWWIRRAKMEISTFQGTLVGANMCQELIMTWPYHWIIPPSICVTNCGPWLCGHMTRSYH